MCPFCGSDDTKVLETRPCRGDIIRRRMCKECSRRFSTAERITAEWLQVRKRDGRVEPFRRDKLVKSIAKAASAHQLSPADVTTFVDRVVQVLHPDAPNIPIPSSELGKLVLRQLHGDALADVVRIRYAMVLLGRATDARRAWRLEDFKEWLQEEYGEPRVIQPEATPTVVIKRNGKREPFQPEKLARSIGIAAKGRGEEVDVRRLAQRVTTRVEQELRGQAVVTSQQVAAEALKVLREHDRLAYLRYASIVKRYQSVDDVWLDALGLDAR
jgi:transcriptional repressor NrdR